MKMEKISVNVCFHFTGNVKLEIPQDIYEQGYEAVVDHVFDEQHLYFDDMKDNMELAEVEPDIYEEEEEECQ